MQGDNNYIIGVVGLGYVGLPLAELFSRKYTTKGYDKKPLRIDEILLGFDRTGEVPEFLLKKAIKTGSLTVANEVKILSDCNIIIVTVPTPISPDKKPNFSCLTEACIDIAKNLRTNSLIVFESTVYPGVTEDICIPLIEKYSGMTLNTDFFVGYSPERVNPSDKNYTIDKIPKIISATTKEALNIMDEIYGSIITSELYKAPSIKVAEAAKVIENTQRDINIAFVNELSKIFNKLDIDTYEVLKAARTKWNFLDFRPGLVGGHCIGVDPYYLAQCAIEHNYHPNVILAGREVNDSMGEYIAMEVIKLMIKSKIAPNEAEVLLAGVTFKENCPDIRNSKVPEIYNILNEYVGNIDLYDPIAYADEVCQNYSIRLENKLPNKKYDVIIISTMHEGFADIDWKSYAHPNAIIFDVKGILDISIKTAGL